MKWKINNNSNIWYWSIRNDLIDWSFFINEPIVRHIHNKFTTTKYQLCKNVALSYPHMYNIWVLTGAMEIKYHAYNQTIAFVHQELLQHFFSLVIPTKMEQVSWLRTTCTVTYFIYCLQSVCTSEDESYTMIP